MNIRRHHISILVILAVGVIGGFATDAAFWADMGRDLLSVVSILAAGVLVRLARGVPFSSIKDLDPGEAKKLAYAIKRSVRVLEVMLWMCFLTIACLLLVPKVPAAWGAFNFIAFATSFFLAFVLVRAFAVVRNDVQIADIQANILVGERNREAAAEFEKKVAAPARETYRQPPDYGRVIDGD